MAAVSSATSLDEQAKPLRCVCVGAGYFSQFHFDAWQRLLGIEVACIVDQDSAKAKAMADRFDVPHASANVAAAVDQHGPDFLDIITPPATHMGLVELAAERGLPVICQKPLAPTFGEAEQLVAIASKAGIRLMVHENFRFQPWHRELRKLIDGGAVGRLQSISLRCRMGDGAGPDAYLDRQPYFRTMPRLFMHETGVHFIDTFRYLTGRGVTGVDATLRRLNPVIAGEDSAIVTLRFEDDIVCTIDANRTSPPDSDDPRYTFGTFIVEGDGGTIRLAGNGNITVQPTGQPPREHDYHHAKTGFTGDSVFATQQHLVDCLRTGEPFETSGDDYLRTLRVVEEIYVDAGWPNKPAAQRRVVDLSLPITQDMPGVSIEPAKTIERDGWNASTLTLYSHAGTHCDAPAHFLPGGATLDRQDLAVCCGPARMVDLTPTEPGETITVAKFVAAAGPVSCGERLLLRTDWHLHAGDPANRDRLPHVGHELADWLVERGVAMIGVEPRSVADVRSLDELTAVHQALFNGGVFIVEGLTRLDRLGQPTVEFVALPLHIPGGDGSPVRAIAIESAGECGHD